MLHDAPRHFVPSPGLPGAGLPHDRLARLAASQAFTLLKASFLDAVHDLPAGGWLMHQLRSAEEPGDLWLLRAPVFALLAASERRDRRRELRRGLETLFGDDEPASAFSPL